jgi:exosortase H (IPTLxxWG-CTERM-specific)
MNQPAAGGAAPSAEGLPLDLRYFMGYALLFFVLAGSLPDRFLAPLNSLTAALAGHCLALLGRDVTATGDLLTVSGFAVRIIAECTALYALLLLAAFICAQPARPRERLTGLVLGAGLLLAVNSLRIALVVVIGADAPRWFAAAHVYLGQVVMVVVTLGLALAWRNRLSAPSGGGMALLLRTLLYGTLFFPLWLVVHGAYVRFLDGLVVGLFALAGREILIPRTHSVAFQTCNVVLLAALLAAEQRCPPRRRLVWFLVGFALLAGEHLLFRVGNVLLTAFGTVGLLQPTILLTIVGEYLLPVLLWLAARQGWPEPAPDSTTPSRRCP